ncbi:MAG: L,D-transpeptidase family protein [Pseudomonadota bacterium]
MVQAQNHDIVVRALSCRFQQGWLQIGTLRFRCALGQNGRGILKREGDGLSPIGRWPIHSIFVRADKRPLLLRPALTRRHRVRPIQPTDGWCDAPGDANYNRLVRHPYPASAEQLCRNDRLYDIIVVLGYNHCPRVQGRGSAIFMHIAEDDGNNCLKPTAGCVALRLRDLQTVLAHCHRSTHICIMT